MGSFNWQDEEGSWDATKNLAESDESQPLQTGLANGNRRTLILGFGAVGILALSALMWWWIGSVEDDLSADVLESWRIVTASQAAGDTELLVNQLSGSDENWINTQKLLLQRNTLTARGTLLPSLVMMPDTELSSEPPEFDFSPDLIEATFSHPTKYQDRWGREINLQQDEIFRLGADRWLFSPPKAAYWGIDVTGDELQFSDRFVYSAPAKDAELAEKIVLWFEDRLNVMCLDEFSYACKTVETQQVSIRFSPTVTDRILEQSFYVGHNLARDDEYTFEFPAPSLVGLPVSATDEQRLIEAYGELYFADYLQGIIAMTTGYGLRQDSCLRGVAEYAAQQADAVAPLMVKDYERYVTFTDKINQDGFAVALDDRAQQVYSELFLS